MQFKIQAVPTHIITGFLGAGKTTVLKHLLSQKPADETWAVLMNEFGEIGIDQTWIAEQNGVAVKEVLGGCLCCTSQLPMQIALARLLSEFKPTRLFIEPTGLGHPKELVDQLSQAHWQTSLSLRQVVTVVDGHRLHEQLWQQHEIFLQQIDVADIVLVSYHQQMSAQDEQQLAFLKQAYAEVDKQWFLIDHGQIVLTQLDQLHTAVQIKKQSLLIQQHQNLSQTEMAEPKTLPYHYVSKKQVSGQQAYIVAGWHLPKSWQFDADQLLSSLQQLKHCERIKGKLNTNQGWIDINVIPANFQIDFAAHAGLDNRLEIISQIEQDWLAIEKSLLDSQIDNLE
ncbi:MAG: GTP-binding protein [Acinetobacter populi]|jgi:G3E family GTPase|uniref:CobW family GTP-binding protein n=1 Tax=Acinetobacter populi TaxID=1582270 RepID=UPI0023520610|nr:GTP-binding protein [Acinetobacter populi]MCH4247213.1 GTP-binding protein [Acinetobacter populi]